MVVKVAPVLKLGLLLLKVAVGTYAGLPFPFPDELVEAMPVVEVDELFEQPMKNLMNECESLASPTKNKNVEIALVRTLVDAA